MDNPARSDKTLLDRLNALKPTPITLDRLSKFLSASSDDAASQPVSKEDALSDRLKSLRLQAESKGSNPDSEIHRSDQSLSTLSSAAHPQTITQGVNEDISARHHGSATATPTVQGNIDDVDPLLYTDDQTLEELLADLGSDEQWLEEVAAEVTADEEQRKVAALLEELGKTPPKDSDADKLERCKAEEGEDYSSDDDSDGEVMQRESDDLLAQAMDEVEWDNQQKPKPVPQAMTPNPLKPDVISDDASTRQNTASANPAASSNLVDSDPFNLPSVPSELQDQPDLPDATTQDANFEAEIASRMAKLKALGPDKSLPSVPTFPVDELGLPMAPTFDPEDRPVKGVYKRYGYTDDDQKTWCTVCLEDGAIRCIGCDGDVYCARCWKEMHGPNAGYEERGHQWEKFVKDKW